MFATAEENPGTLIRVKLLKDGISVGNRVHQAGDVVNVPDHRARDLFQYEEAAYADPSRHTPTPAEIVADRLSRLR